VDGARRTLALYADAARGMRARQVAYRARRLLPMSVLAAGTAERTPPAWRPLAAGTGVDAAPQSGPQEPSERRGVFTFVGSAARFCDEPEFWRPAGEGLLFALHLHGFADLARYAAGPRTAAGDAFWARVAESWLRHAGAPAQPAWHPYATSGRVVAWCAALSAGDWPAELERRMLRSLTRQAAVLQRCVEHDVGGNHVLRNAAALAVAGLCLGDDRRARRALALLRGETRSQLLADGGHEERSTAYHRAVRADLDTVATVLARARGSVPEWLETARSRMSRWERAMRGPDGRLPLLNDAWEGPADPAPRDDGALTVLRQSGYVVLRHARDQAIIDAGPVAPRHLPPHAHADVLSFVLWADGRALVVDPGSFAYSGPHRALFRGTAAHNTVQVDGADQCELWADFRAAFTPRIVRLDVDRRGATVVVAARHDGYRRLSDPVEHERWFWWVPGEGLVVVDRLHAARPHHVTSRLHLAPGVRTVAAAAAGPFAIHWLGPGNDPLVVAGEYAPYLGTRLRTDVLERRGSIRPGALFGCAILRRGAAVALDGRRLTLTRRGGERESVELI
jgi:uncharacterized heparinase superfamily protein